MPQLSIRQFEPGQIKPFRKHLFIGGSGRGKTQGLLSILSHIAPTVDMCLLFCPTETTREFFRRRRMIPDSHIFPSLDLDIIAKALASMRELRARGKKRSLLLCLDDCSFEKKTWLHPTMQELLYNQRHLGIHTFITAQYVLDLPPNARSNIDYVYTTSDSCFANIKRLHNCFFGCFRRAEDMHRVHTATTKDFALCVADLTQVAVESPADMVFYYRAPAQIPKFAIGRDIYWKLEEKQRLRVASEQNGSPVITVPTDERSTTSRQRVLIDAI